MTIYLTYVVKDSKWYFRFSDCFYEAAARKKSSALAPWASDENVQYLDGNYTLTAQSVVLHVAAVILCIQ